MLKKSIDAFFNEFISTGFTEIIKVHEATIKLLINIQYRMLSGLPTQNTILNNEAFLESVLKIDTLKDIKEFVFQYLKERHDVVNHDNDSENNGYSH
jgi:hypothetical protein